MNVLWIFDIDGVLAQGEEVTQNNYEEWKRKVFHSGIRPNPKGIQLLQAVAKMDCQVLFLTNRSYDMADVTLQWLKGVAQLRADLRWEAMFLGNTDGPDHPRGLPKQTVIEAAVDSYDKVIVVEDEKVYLDNPDIIKWFVDDGGTPIRLTDLVR